MGRIASFADMGCLVTGASSGIGRALALLLAAEGARIAITARREDRLRALAAELEAAGAAATHVIVEDLARADAPKRLFAAAEEALGGVDVLINNAGFAAPGHYVRVDYDRTLAMIQVNCAAVAGLARLALPGMVKRGRGGMLTVASVAAFQAAPYQSGYGATKGFDLLLSDGIHQEVKHTPLAITALCPGVTDTEFFDAAGYTNLSGFLNKRMPVERCARVGLAAFRKGKMTIIPGLTNKLVVFLQRFLPRSWVAGLSRRVLKGRGR